MRVACSNAVSCLVGSYCAVKSWKSRNYLRYFGSFNLFAVNKDISLSKLRGRLFTIFTAYIVFVFLACMMFLTMACLRSIFGVVVFTEACGL